jgi:hypothetical protein
MRDHSPTAGFARRLAHVRALIENDPAAAGDQGVKLLEEYLEHLAVDVDCNQNTGSIGRYVGWLRKRGPLSRDLLDRCETYAQVRNCLAHSYGLQTSAALAAEVVDFLCPPPPASASRSSKPPPITIPSSPQCAVRASRR